MSVSHAVPPAPASAGLSLFCAGACAVVAALSLLGWTTGAAWLTSVQPGLPSMVPLTAVLMMAGSAAVVRQARGRAGRAPSLLMGGAAVLLLALHTLLHMRLAVPGLALIDPAWLSSPVTALMFLIAALSLLCIGRPHRVHEGQWLALAVLMLALLTLASYAFRGTALYVLLPAQGTSVLTTFAFSLIAGAILALRPDAGAMVAIVGPQPGARVARRLLLSALSMPLLLGLGSGLALHLGAVDVTTAIAFLVWGMIALFTAVVWQSAHMLHRADVARRAAECDRERALAALREADAHKDDFLALIAHELRNPLAPIRAAADLLRVGAPCDPDQLRRTSDIISRQVGHMVHLVDDLLDLSRVSRGLITLERRPVDLHAAVSDALEQARPQLARRRHRLDTELPDVHPIVLGDHKRLVQVLANLLGNAAKYTPEGGHVRLRLRMHEHARAREAEVSVEDDGIGIDAGLLPHVFDSFIQGSRSAGRAEGGLGLGLALVKRLAELHGGTVSAHSEGPGQGSRFVLVLPCIDDAGPPGSGYNARSN